MCKPNCKTKAQKGNRQPLFGDEGGSNWDLFGDGHCISYVNIYISPPGPYAQSV